MIYEERSAPPGLEDVVSRLWFLETAPLQRFEKILPLPFVHVIANLSAPYRLFDRDGEATEVSDVFVSGLQTGYLVIESPPLIRHVGLELAPAGLHALVPGAPAPSAGRVQDARAVLPGIDTLVARLSDVSAPGGALDVMTDYVSAMPGTADPLVSAALARIDDDPDATMGSLATGMGVSHRTFIARFRTVTGLTPKTFAQVLRFHRFVDALHASPGSPPNWAGLAATNGYYDQPHVIRAFRRFSGWTPTEYHRLVAEYGPDAAHFVPLEQAPVHARS